MQKAPESPVTPKPILQLDTVQIAAMKGHVGESLKREGFLDWAFLDLRQVPKNEAIARFLEEERHAEMHWMKNTLPQRSDPARHIAPEYPAAVITLLNYASPRNRESARTNGIAAYAQGRDYHNVFRSRLKRVLKDLQANISGIEGRIHADSGPLSEKWLATHAGLGWIGRNTNLISRHHGSFFLIGCLLLNCEITDFAPASSHCGNCMRCIAHCPTQAITADGRMDARKCLSWQTIESFTPAEPELLQKSDWIFGCDDCQTCCPWNRFSKENQDEEILPRERYTPEFFAGLNEASFLKEFEGSPVRRAGYQNFMHNFITQIRNRTDWQTKEILNTLHQHEDHGIQTLARELLKPIKQ